MLAKINVPATDEGRLVAATTGAAREDSKVERNLDSGAVISYVPHSVRNDCLHEGACGNDH